MNFTIFVEWSEQPKSILSCIIEWIGLPIHGVVPFVHKLVL